MGDIVNISRVFSWIRNRHRIAIFIEIYVCPGFFRRIVFIFVIGSNFRRTRVRGDIAAMYCFLAGIVALGESRSKKETWNIQVSTPTLINYKPLEEY